MRQILNSIWEQPYFRGTGDRARGSKVFTGKGRTVCHNDPSSGAPALAKWAVILISRWSRLLWRHGPAMLERVKQRNLAWPRFTVQQMADLIAHLNTLPAR